VQNSLQAVLEQKKKKLDTELPTWNQRKEEWIKKVDNLYSLIKNWMEPLANHHYLKLSYSDISISEEWLGQYHLKKWRLFFLIMRKSN